MVENLVTRPTTISATTISAAVESSPQGKTSDHGSSSDQILDEVGQKSTVDEPASLQLPSDFPKTPSTLYQPGYHKFSLSSDLIESLNAQAQHESTNVRSLLLTAFKALLNRYTHQEAIGLGLLILDYDSDQMYATEISSLIHDEIDIRNLVHHLSATLEAIAPENLPDSQNQPTGQQNQQLRSPIIATFITDSSGIENEKHLILEVQQKNHRCINNVELNLVIFQREQEITGIFTYNSNLFEADTIQRLSSHFQVLLSAISQDLNSSIAQLPLLTQTEQHQLLVEWNSETVSYPELPIYQQIETYAAQNPDQIALTCKGKQFTYGELNQRVNQLAHYLTSVGVGAEVRVAVCVQPSLEIAVSLLGILKAGGVYVPLDPAHPKDRLTSILEDTQAKVLLTQAQLQPGLPAIADHTLCLDQDWKIINAFPTHNPANEISLDQTAYIIYTSGTTGKPKGVMASHRNLVNYILATQERLGFDHHDVMPSIARYTFSISIFELLSPLAAGGILTILDREHVLDFAQMVQTLEQLTMIHTVPSLMQKLLGYIKDNELNIQKFQGVKHVFTGGDTVSPDLLEEMKGIFPNANVAVLYGCSEVSSLCTTYPVPKTQIVTKSRIGKPFNNVAVRLYDSQQNLVPIGLLGEIYVGGAGVTKGYLNREDLTQEKFVTIDGQRFYRTGDLGRFGTDGNLEFLGRADFQIKLRGIRIELGDIETTLRQVPGVREGVVMARDFGSSENRLVAYVVLDQVLNPSIEEIHRFLQTKLPDYMVPAAFVALEALPLNPNQKVDRRALPMPTSDHWVGLKTIVSPRNEGEQQLTQIWQAVLGIQLIGIQNDFFELGGDSLLAVQIFAQIEEKFGKRLPLSTLLSAPTIEQLATVLQSNQTHLQNSLTLLKAGQTKPPVFFIHDGDGETLLYRSLAYALDPEVPVYGIQPFSSDSCPILHTRISSIVDYYIEQIRQVQPQGPYFLGGMCAGGILAFEMALRLQEQGESVEMVVIIEAADAGAAKRTGYIANQRLKRLSTGLSGNDHLKPHEQLLYMLNQIRKKTTNLAVYESQRRLEIIRDRIQLKLLRNCLEKGLPVPRGLQGIPVRKVLLWAEQDYVFQGMFVGEILLFRATQKSNVFDGTLVDDTPYVELYSDPLFGWGKRVSEKVQVYDIPGGHSSMLQEPNVQVIAEKIQAYFDTAIATEEPPVALLPQS
ncbi:non-ribosomal peptide synthetase [Myxacorys almedinensis]|uniref:Amino acid adenylation domain-containing protein n=1 Tax=Myxacorys almedinensis A TaxID=2690445 RepID=A0A8J7Z506_9CYAN|nr:non-ribosomal peptide synthetase [Myxacorys almedinensis]NDJ18218.1 amino acid adenylation domain-containing protein [Myxacorys almedinensis A]